MMRGHYILVCEMSLLTWAGQFVRILTVKKWCHITAKFGVLKPKMECYTFEGTEKPSGQEILMIGGRAPTTSVRRAPTTFSSWGAGQKAGLSRQIPSSMCHLTHWKRHTVKSRGFKSRFTSTCAFSFCCQP